MVELLYLTGYLTHIILNYSDSDSGINRIFIPRLYKIRIIVLLFFNIFKYIS